MFHIHKLAHRSFDLLLVAVSSKHIPIYMYITFFFQYSSVHATRNYLCIVFYFNT